MDAARPFTVIASVVALSAGTFACQSKLGSEAASRPSASADASTPLVTTKREACHLLTTDEASKLLDGAAKAFPYDKMKFASSCIWEAPNPRRGLIVMTSSREQLRADEALRAVDGETPEKRFAQIAESQSAAGKVEPVPNLGDAALWVEKAGELWVLEKNRALVTVGFQGNAPGTDARERSLAAARLILPRLGG
jgi:hypothetical protein